MKREILCKWFSGSSLVREEQHNALHEVVISAIKTTICMVLYKYVATCFDQLHGHPQATRAHKTQVKLQISFWVRVRYKYRYRYRYICRYRIYCCTVHINKI